MKINFFISVILIICFASCDGRERAQNNNKENLENSKLSDSFYESISYFPKEYSEVITDTILSNGFRVTIKFYSDMYKNVLNDFKIDTINYKHYYREFKGDLMIEKKGKIIFNKTIGKSFFTDKLNEMFWKNAIMGDILLDENLVTNEHLYINVFFCIPESEICKNYNIIIDTNGASKTEELESQIH